jgi:hypothetical protein
LRMIGDLTPKFVVLSSKYAREPTVAPSVQDHRD